MQVVWFGYRPPYSAFRQQQTCVLVTSQGFCSSLAFLQHGFYNRVFCDNMVFLLALIARDFDSSCLDLNSLIQASALVFSIV